ncbi:fasciclin domain-containing protein [Dyadobacter sp. CY261]|uniref:fasciclin domain-containing protein n=1 Tax=Dyadobacter sp. CY261 TaxID=2907203 RepID=UPI001F2C4E10|nr:fasciclin domain-containing protein [Dyadobacter sp. CY261]MCF0075217.1 fasciclin domain-containing protein [Dyadobacter sp. CY261]
MRKYFCAGCFVIGGFALSLFSCSESEKDIVKSKSIIEIISSNPEFTTLKSIIQYAGMSDTLAIGTFTMFAPSNSALEKIKISDASTILRMPKDSVKWFVKYHLLGKQLNYSGFEKGQLTNINKQTIAVTKDAENSDILINLNRVVTKDVSASNGLIQVIDSVLIKIK